jgi:nitroreductase/dihydropteridine reductase
MEKQVYLALGTLLLGAAALEIDACPIEGFDVKLLNDALDLRAQGLSAVVVVALGYRAADDFNAALPKSRLPMDEVLSEI